MTFVCSLARLYAAVCGVQCSESELSVETVASVAAATRVPEFRPSSKVQNNAFTTCGIGLAFVAEDVHVHE